MDAKERARARFQLCRCGHEGIAHEGPIDACMRCICDGFRLEQLGGGMSRQELTELREEHYAEDFERDADDGDDEPETVTGVRCAACSNSGLLYDAPWPCVVVRLLDEIDRLRGG